MTDKSTSIGETIRQLREAKKLSLMGLGEKSGVHWNAIARIERGERQPDYATVETLLDALGHKLKITRQK